MGNNDTFVNMDEVRGWGVRALREIHGKRFSRNKGKCLLKIMAGTGMFLVGLGLIMDGNEKYGFWEGAERIINKDMDDAYVKDAHSMGYKINGE